jgi:hypothetical protein
MRLGAPWNWYAFDSKHALELLTHYARRIEAQIDAGVVHYKLHKGKDFIVDNEELGIGQEVEFYDGLDSMSWDLDDLHECYFPNLQRKSAFLTMYAFLEHELEKLSRKLKAELSLTPELDDVAGKGVQRSMMYMQLIVNLQIEKGASEWNQISEINQLRNLIIHNDGQLFDHDGKRKREAKIINQLSRHLSEKDDELILGPTFLKHVIQKFDELFQYLDQAIQLKFPSKHSRGKSLFKRKNKNGKK